MSSMYFCGSVASQVSPNTTAPGVLETTIETPAGTIEHLAGYFGRRP